jgi:hypothetical protein
VLINLEALTDQDIRTMWAGKANPSGALSWRTRFGLTREEAARRDTDPEDRLRVAYLGGLIAFPVAPRGGPRGPIGWEVFDGYKYLGLNLPWSAEWKSEWFEGFPDLGPDVRLDDLLWLWEHRDAGPAALLRVVPHPLIDTNDVRVALEALL